MCAGELRARADADDQSALGDAVDGGQDVRQRQGMPEQWQQHRRAKGDSSRRAGDGGQQGKGFAARTRQERVSGPNRVVSGLFGPPRRLDEKGQVALRPQQGLSGREQQPGFRFLLWHFHLPPKRSAKVGGQT
jgi:hypothetical protein